MNEEEAQEVRESINESLGVHKDDGKLLSTSKLNNESKWEMRRIHDVFGFPTWYATLTQTNEE